MRATSSSERSMARQFLDRSPIEIAGREIHLETAAEPQHVVDQTHALEQTPSNPTSEIARMLVMILRTVTFAAPCPGVRRARSLRR